MLLPNQTRLNENLDDDRVLRGVLSPYNVRYINSTVAVALNAGGFCLVSPPVKRVVTRFWWWQGATAAANMAVGIFRVVPGNVHTRLWTSPQFAAPAANTWGVHTISPGLVLEPKNMYALWFGSTNATLAYGRRATVTLCITGVAGLGYGLVTYCGTAGNVIDANGMIATIPAVTPSSNHFWFGVA